ncbi:hypothetical protein MHZ90_14785 [Pantoea sp. ACRSH]|uniref:hypothetical protein n=1 Tax=Pantoea TaxID=53335 RepID=UPI001EF650EC|nr:MULTISPECIES: hypothetical protein [Pantoea]MCG7367387.1 hypothetical protein [Pantoea sp. ACRSH]MCG7397680.1 hypothetical protein [Pantoea sp. ACRSC]
MLQEIEIPEFNDPEWQIEQLRIISGCIERIKELNIDEAAYIELLVIEAHIEALREYSGY